MTHTKPTWLLSVLNRANCFDYSSVQTQLILFIHSHPEYRFSKLRYDSIQRWQKNDSFFSLSYFFYFLSQISIQGCKSEIGEVDVNVNVTSDSWWQQLLGDVINAMSWLFSGWVTDIMNDEVSKKRKFIPFNLRYIRHSNFIGHCFLCYVTVFFCDFFGPFFMILIKNKMTLSDEPQSLSIKCVSYSNTQAA